MYTQLDTATQSIPLLYLSPNLHEDGHNQCSLVLVSLHTSPSYEALSYTRGDPDDLGLQVKVDGTLFGVRQNLWNALDALKSNQSTDRVLWIDAICIDHTNDKERTHQVGIMREIYAGAATVIAWLCIPQDLKSLTNTINDMEPLCSQRKE